MGWFRWLIVSVAATAIVAFIAGAALMGSYASKHQPAASSEGPNTGDRPDGKGVVGDVPGVGDATRKAARPAVRPLCQGASHADGLPVLGPVVLFTVDGVARASGTGGCST